MIMLVDIGHPAHVHLFRHFAREMQNKGHSIYFTYREREFVELLLICFSLKHLKIGKHYRNSAGKIFGLFLFTWRLYFIARKLKPDLFISHGSMYAALAAFLFKKPHVSLEDTYNFEQVTLYKPFTKAILTSIYEHPLKSKKVIRYSGYHELAYLHPNRFTPDASILTELELDDNQPYVILRFVSWEASHDKNHKGISLENKINLVREFSKYAKVFISSEAALPEELDQYRIMIAPERIHHAIAFASLIFGESATISEEAAILGIPSIYLYDRSTYYTQHLEKEYNLLFNYSESYSDQKKAIEKGVELLRTRRIKEQWKIRRNKMLSERIDVTAFLVWFFESWPESLIVMRNTPEYQYNFK